jgi:hypothetical protein
MKGPNMAKRIEIYPPNGGEPIEIWEQDLPSMQGKGWRTEKPSASKTKATKAPAADAETKTPKE